MEITYKNTKQDFVKLILLNTRLNRKAKLVNTIFYLIFFIYISWVTNLFVFDNLSKLITNIVIFIIFFLVFIKIFHLIGLLLYILSSSREKKGFYCEHSLIIDDESIKEITEINSSESKLNSLHKIVYSKNRIYIFIAPGMAHIIPYDNVITGNYENYLNLLLDICAKNVIDHKYMNDGIFVSYLKML
jgi:hypothetical protein